MKKKWEFSTKMSLSATETSLFLHKYAENLSNPVDDALAVLAFCLSIYMFQMALAAPLSDACAPLKPSHGIDSPAMRR